VEADYVSAGVDDDFTIDASHSFNPNNRSATLSHEWKCTDVPTGDDCKLTNEGALHGSMIKIPGSTLIEGHA
jgi:hypothetical protein